MSESVVIAAGRAVPNAIDRIRRYCGLPWSGGPPETWAWQYYDAVPTDEDHIGPVDVLCAAALHPGLSRDDLAWFRDRRGDVEVWLLAVPVGVPLGQLSSSQLAHVVSLPEVLPGPTLALLSKVVHRKRPEAIPLLDRHIIDWYRPVTRRRAAAEAWGPIVETMADEDRSIEPQVRVSIDAITEELAGKSAARLTPVRARDIAIWMGSR